MEDDREMRVDETLPADSNGDRDRERYSSRRDDRDRDRDRDRSRSRERYSTSRRDDDRDRRHRRSYSRSRSPRRHRHRSHSRSRSRSRDRHHRDRRARFSPPPLHAHRRYGHGRDREGGEQSVGGPMNAPMEEAEAHAKISKRENRLYVGNLPYDCNYKDLEKFMSGGGGEVIFSEVLVTPGGQSKGCGIVEFANSEDARRAKEDLADKQLLGRPVFIREDREENARFGAPPIPGKIGMATGEARNFLGPNGGNPNNRNLFIGNLPLQASWQDLKDLMRQAGEVIRTDVGMFPDGSPKGNGTVVFVNPQDAKAAIEMFHGFDWFGSILEVREDRFAGMGGGFRGGRGGFGMGRGGFGMGRGGFGPGFRGGFGGPGFRGGFRGGRGGFGGGMGGHGGFGGAAAGGRNFSNDLYADYNGPEGGAQNGGEGAAATAGLRSEPAEPNQQILVRNLPWSTSNEDLVELFETVGSVTLAEILYDGTRSKGEGIVQFTETAEAQTAGEKFTGYQYGGRPLDVQFNPRWHDFSSSAVKGGQAAA